MSEDQQCGLNAIVLKLEKDGNLPSEYEDNAKVLHVQTGARLAIADGATDGVFAGAWAELLVGRFVLRPFWTWKGCAYQVRRLGWQWRHKHAQMDLPWYAARKLEQGAAATLIGVRISVPHRRAASGSWRAISIGDACLFHMQSDTLLQMHPDLKAGDFGNSPALIYTNISRKAQVLSLAAGSWQSGDIFMLASDALAHWIRLSIDGGNGEWRVLLALADKVDIPDREAAFSSWARQEQGNGRLKNDDLTLVLCRS